MRTGRVFTWLAGPLSSEDASLPLLLHLSDLHLAPPGRGGEIGDYKSEIVPENQRQRRAGYIKTTLRALGDYLRAKGRSLDAIIITGDITLKGDPAGFELLPETLDELGDRLPPADGIVVVPGNHDVVFGTPPSSRERYEPFINGVRRRGYVTPLLDGVDNEVGGDYGPFLGPFLQRDGYVVVAMNSVDYAGCSLPLSGAARAELDAAAFDGVPLAAVKGELEQMRLLYDAPRINPIQFEALARAMSGVVAESDLVRIAAFHHQIAPVSTDEEVKPFESFINLGELRMFISDQDIAMVLHGHKHISRVVEDIFVPYGSVGDQPRPATRALVLSCGSIDTQPAIGREIAKLIDLNTQLPHRRWTSIRAIKAVSAGGHLPTTRGGDLATSARDHSVHDLSASPTADTPVVLHGLSAADVHEQIEQLALLQPKWNGSPVLCVVEDGSSALHAPPTYPYMPGDTGLDAWFDATIQWWQSSERNEGKPFTHGQFIRDWPGQRRTTDQIQAVIDALEADSSTSRGVITLLNPPRLDDKRVKFPAFCSLQFARRDSFVDAYGTFRKQELRYWWPINAAEIAKLQSEVVHGLRGKGHDCQAGRVTTFAHMTLMDRGLPKLAIPRIEQLAWSTVGLLELSRFALAIITPAMRSADVASLHQLLDELHLPTEMPKDGPATSVHGLEVLQQAVSGIAGDTASDRVRRIVEHLKRLADLGNRATSENLSQERYARYRDDVAETLKELIELLSVEE